MLPDKWSSIRATASMMEMCVLEYNRTRSTISLQGGECDWVCDLYLQDWEADAKFDQANQLWEQALEESADVTYDDILLSVLA